MSEELALGIVAAARMLEVESKSKRRYGTLRFNPSQQCSPWFVFVPPAGTFQSFHRIADALNYMADKGFYVTPSKAQEYLAMSNKLLSAGGGTQLEFLIWTDM